MVELTYANMAQVNGAEDEDDLQGLTQEELDELNDAMDDPDNQLLSAGYRAPDQTTKSPTGPLDRDHLMKYLKEEAKTIDYGEDFVPFEKKIRGKVYKPKEKKKSKSPLLPDDLSEVLDTATEDELLELAAVLGIHGMLTQSQSEIVDSDKAWDSLKGSGLKKFKPGITKATKTRQYTNIDAINELNLDEALDRLKSFDSTLTELNLNNHKDLDEEKLFLVAHNLKDNVHLKSLYMANTQMPDRVCKVIAESLRHNKTLENLNLESNFLTRESVFVLLKTLEVNNTLRELKLSNQGQKMGHQLEVAIGKTLAKNESLLRFGFSFESRGPRHIVNKHIMRNNDLYRSKRQEEQRLEMLENLENSESDDL